MNEGTHDGNRIDEPPSSLRRIQPDPLHLPDTMDFRSLRYFAEVAHQKSFTLAAQKLFVTQPTLWAVRSGLVRSSPLRIHFEGRIHRAFSRSARILAQFRQASDRGCFQGFLRPESLGFPRGDLRRRGDAPSVLVVEDARGPAPRPVQPGRMMVFSNGETLLPKASTSSRGRRPWRSPTP